jgi:hypothetical protein
MKNTTFLKIILHNKISQYHQLDPLDHQFHSPSLLFQTPTAAISKGTHFPSIQVVVAMQRISAHELMIFLIHLPFTQLYPTMQVTAAQV